MRKSILIAACIALTVACQSKVANENSNQAMAVSTAKPEQIVNVNRPVEKAPLYTPTPAIIKTSEINSRIGNVEAFTAGLCLKIQNPNLLPGDKIRIIITEVHQKTAMAEVVEKTACEGERFAGDLDEPDILEYKLKEIGGNLLDRSGYGIGLVNPLNEPKIKGEFVTIDIDNDQKAEYFRACTSSEGMHLTVWKGKPLMGDRIWHSYYHFSYDTEPDCKKKDYEGTDE